MDIRRALILTTAVVLVSPMARSGHEQAVYPSYYPHEIEITAMALRHAVDLMQAGKLHAYVGDGRRAIAAPSDKIGVVESLGAFVVVRLNRDSVVAKDEASSCSAAATIVREMAARGAGLAVHPYPVTPFHGDYLNHVDRAEAARQRLMSAPALSGDLKVRVVGNMAGALIRLDWLSDGTSWDAMIEEISASALVAGNTVALNGWLGPPWARTGWYQAYRLLGAAMMDRDLKQHVDARVEQLLTATHDEPVKRINQERELVRLLSSSCRTMVAGYTVKREIFNADYSAGIENLAFDALDGLSSPLFLRTVKLKDFPWNGWLHLGLGERPAAAWNPIGGFTDDFGRLTWFAVGDPALVPSPYESAWMLNRMSDVERTPRR